jgi:hypothetical protein
VLSGEEVNVLAKLPKVCSMIDRIQKIRRKNNVVLNLNNSFLPEKMKITLKNEKFLLYDNNSVDSRILIFTTYQNLLHLENSDCWVCDGTFDAAPQEFTQLYTIQSCVRGKFYPLVFCITKKRTEEVYKTIFDIVLNQFKKNIKKVIISDFETAATNVISSLNS